MSRVLFTISATIVVFALGILAGRWMQSTQPVPPPPIGIMGELRDVPLSGTPLSPRHAPPRDTPQLRAELERMRPAIEEFRRKVDPIRVEFRENLEAILKPEQREKLKALDERFSSIAAPPPPSGPDSGEHPRRLRGPHDGLDSIFPIVLVPTTLDRLTDELQLDESQRSAVRELLVQRRQKFLELIDTSPPPSLRLGRLAPLVPQLARPDAK